MAIQIRKAVPKDFESVHQFVSELEDHTFDKESLYRIFTENIANSNKIYLLAEINDQPVGYISCHIQTLLHHGGKVAEIQELYVNESCRSRGVGKLMIDEIKTLTKEMGALQLEVATRQTRSDAIRFYVRESFKDSHKKLVYYFQ